MKEGWTYRDFVECLKKVPKQKAVKSKDYLETGLYPVVSQESCLVSGYSNDKDLLYSHERPVVIFGDHTKNVKYVDFDFVVGADGVHILDIKEDILPKFFYYELCSIKLRDLGYARHYKLLKEKRIKFPSLPEQERIVSYLDAQFAKIDALKANTEQQLQAAKDLFQSALKEMLTPKEGWEKKTLGDIAKSTADGPFGSNLKAEHYTSERQVRIIQLSNIGDFCWRDENVKYTTFEHLKTIARSEVKPNEVVIAKMMPAGRAILCPNIETKYVLSSDAVRVELKEGYDPNFIQYYINSNHFNTQVIENVTGSGRVRTSLTKLRSYYLYIPNYIEQKQLAKDLDIIYAKIIALQANYDQTINLCNDLKQSLLKSIFE